MEAVYNYVLPACTLAVGILGILFSKAGEWNKVNVVGWVLLALTVTIGTVSIVNIKRNSDKAEEQAAVIERQRKDLSKIRNLLVANTFSRDDKPLKSILAITWGVPSSEEAVSQARPQPAGGESSDWAPFVSNNVEAINIIVKIEGVLDYDLALSSGPGRRLNIRSKYYEHDEKVCNAYLLADNPGESQYEQRPVCVRSNKVADSFSFDSTPANAFIINLGDKTPFWKLFSRIQQHIELNGPAIEIDFKTTDAAQRKKLEGIFLKEMDYQIKTFKKYSEKDDCFSSLVVRFEPELLEENGARRVVAKKIKDVDVNLCEIVPI